MRAVTRRGLLAGSAAGVIGAAAGCVPPDPGTVNQDPTIPPADGPVTLTYWAWLKDLQKVADVFNATQDRIRVEATWIQGGGSGGYAKILSAVAAGGGPDIAQVELRNVPEFALAGALVDLSRYGFADSEDLFDPGAFSQVRVGDSLYGVPQDTGPVALFYNRDVLVDELGLEPPATWEDYRDLAREVADAGKMLTVLDPTDGSHPIAWAMQSGAVWFRPEGDGWIVDMTDDASVRVGEFWDQMLKDRTLGTNFGVFATPGMAAAGDDKVLSAMTGSWGDALVESIPGASGRWAVAPMPTWKDGYASGAHGGSAAAVLSTSQHPAEALEFLTWMCTDPAGIDAMIEYSGIGWSPAADYIGEVREGPSEFFSGQSYNEDVIRPMAAGQNLDWTWAPLMQRASAILGDGFAAAVNGSTSLVDVFADTQREIVEIMRTMGLDAEEAR